MSQYDFAGFGHIGDALEEALLKQQQLRRQAMLDELNKRNTESLMEDRTTNRRIQEENMKALAGQREALEEQRKTEAAKGVASMMTPDQELDSDSTSKLTAGGLGALVLKGKPGTTTNVEQQPAKVAPDMLQRGAGPDLNGPDKFRGTPTQIKERDQRTRSQDYLDSLDPNSPEARALRYESATGKNAPAGMFKDPDATVPVVRVNPVTGKVETIGDAPKGAHFATEPQPKDHSGQADNRLDRSYQFNSSQLEKFAAPIEERATRLQRLVRTVNEGNPQADALVAPELVTVMAGGMGSGLRINETELQRVVGGRNNWEDLKSAVMKWQTDPSKPFLITPDQRAQVQKLIAVVGQDLNGQLDAIDQGRDELVNASSVEQHRRVVAHVKKSVRTTNPDVQPVAAHDQGAGPKKPKTAADYILQYGGNK